VDDDLLGILMAKEVVVKGVDKTRIWVSYMGDLDKKYKLVAIMCMIHPCPEEIEDGEDDAVRF